MYNLSNFLFNKCEITVAAMTAAKDTVTQRYANYKIL